MDTLCKYTLQLSRHKKERHLHIFTNNKVNPMTKAQELLSISPPMVNPPGIVTRYIFTLIFLLYCHADFFINNLSPPVIACIGVNVQRHSHIKMSPQILQDLYISPLVCYIHTEGRRNIWDIICRNDLSKYIFLYFSATHSISFSMCKVFFILSFIS